MTFFDVLVRYEIDLWNAVERALRDADAVSLAQLQALSVVEGATGMVRVLDIAGGIGVTVGAASKLVDRLERDGLAERRPNPDDRRSSLVVLTSAGVTAHRTASTVRESVLSEVLDPSAAATALAALQNLQARLELAQHGVRA